ncbi:dTDP-4-keto-6-deoxy-D-glucose reductase-like [Styela clava]
MSQIKVTPLFVEGAYVIEFPQYKDHRGYFEELYNVTKYPEEIPITKIQQLSTSHSHANVFRGLHCSPYYKLVTCVSGEVYDIIADVREDSSTYLKWVRVRLTAENHKQVFVPAGCAHAFYATKDNSIMVYAQGGTFNPVSDRTISWKDPVLCIQLPTCDDVIISEKDAKAVDLQLDPIKFKSNRKRILVIGASGKLGSAICSYVDENCEDMITLKTHFEHRVSKGSMKYDLELAGKDQDHADDVLDICCPQVVIICGSWTNVGQCDIEPDKSAEVMIKGPVNIAKCAKRRGIKVVAISTDYVFDGKRGIKDGPYNEADVANPFSAYGKNKYEMEKQIIDATNGDALIVRTTTVNGKDHRQFGAFYTLYEYLMSGKEFFVPEATRSPTYVKDLAKIVIELIKNDAKGIIHGCGDEIGSLLDYFQKVTVVMGFDPNLIKTRERNKYQPEYSAMSSDKRKKLLPNFKSRSTEEAVRDWMDMEEEFCNKIKQKYSK